MEQEIFKEQLLSDSVFVSTLDSIYMNFKLLQKGDIGDGILDIQLSDEGNYHYNVSFPFFDFGNHKCPFYLKLPKNIDIESVKQTILSVFESQLCSYSFGLECGKNIFASNIKKFIESEQKICYN